MKRSIIPMVVALLLSGCGGGRSVDPTDQPPRLPITDVTQPAQVYRTPPRPDETPVVTVKDGQVEIPRVGGTTFLWRTDGEAVAVQMGEGIWSVSADGKRVVRLVAGNDNRLLVGYSAEGVIYIETRPDEIVVARGRDGSSPQVIATLKMRTAEGVPAPIWFHLTGDRLIIIPEGQQASRVDLSDSTVRELGIEPIPVMHGDLALSHGERFLAYKQNNRGDAIRILDLGTGEVHRMTGEAHVAGVEWSSTGDRWAVRSAEPGSGLPRGMGANTVDGATHVDVGDPQGNVRHLLPPERLTLMGGPRWSPDGRLLATVAEERPPADGEPGSSTIWLVDSMTGQWRNIRTLPALWLDGWASDGQQLRVMTPLGRMLLPIDGGDLVPDQLSVEEWTLSPDQRFEAQVRTDEGELPMLIIRPAR